MSIDNVHKDIYMLLAVLHIDIYCHLCYTVYSGKEALTEKTSTH